MYNSNQRFKLEENAKSRKSLSQLISFIIPLLLNLSFCCLYLLFFDKAYIVMKKVPYDVIQKGEKITYSF